MPCFNRRLRQLREEAGLSQQELSNQTGVTKSSINMYERGEREPGLETLELFADFFNVDMNYLTGYQTQKHISNIALTPHEIFAANLQRFMDRAKIDRNQLCVDLGFKYSTVSEWLSSKKYPRIDKIEKLANYFGVQKSDLIEAKGTIPIPLTAHEEKVITAYRDKPDVQPKVDELLEISPTSTAPITPLFDDSVKIAPLRELVRIGGKIPVLGRVPAGVPIEAVTDIVDEIDIPPEWADDGRGYFALKVKGHSMYPDYCDGDYVIIRQQPTADTGEDVVVYIGDDDATLKRLYRDINKIEFRPLNDGYQTYSFTNEEAMEKPVTIAGIVVEMRRNKPTSIKKPTVAPLKFTNPEDAPRLRLADSQSFDSLFDNKPTEE